MKSIRLGILTAATFVLTTLAALAAPGVANYGTAVLASPDKSGAQLGAISAGQRLEVFTCQGYWCQVAVPGGVSGWVPSDAVSATDASPQPQPQPVPPPAPWPQPQPQPVPPAPWPQPQPPNPWPPRPQPFPPQPPVYEDAGACFYSERNFGGASFCLEEGESLNSFRTWDNRIRSVEIFGGARVDLCTDRNLYGNCITLRSDTPRLPRAIDRNGSSVDVY